MFWWTVPGAAAGLASSMCRDPQRGLNFEVDPVLSDRREAVDPVGVEPARQAACQPQRMQVGDRFAHRERRLVQVELAAEQHHQQVGGVLRRLGAGSQHIREALVVVRDELIHARVVGW